VYTRAIYHYFSLTYVQGDFVKSVKKMLLLMYCFGRTCLILPSDRPKLGSPRHFQPGYDFYTRSLPRLANRQLKHLFLRLLRQALDRVLKTLDNSFRSSKGTWSTAFFGMLGLALAFEDMENSVAIHLKTDVKLGDKSLADAEKHLSGISNAIDEKFTFFRKLFRSKHKYSPFDCKTPEQCEERRARLGAPGAKLAEAVGDLMREKRKFPHPVTSSVNLKHS
jgi:hypothetical protein